MESKSTDFRSIWASQDNPQYIEEPDNLLSQWSSLVDLLGGRGTLGDVIRELGVDCNQQADRSGLGVQASVAALPLWGLGPSGAYLRQHSWPAARPPSLPPAWGDFATSTPVFDESQEQQHAPRFSPPAPAASPPPPPPPSGVTEEQARVLRSLPDHVLYPLLRQMNDARRGQMCRFCKNNRERESFYRSHSLKDASGRVTCPVLRAHVCDRCGASGDNAHTIKYCPESTKAEKLKSSAMMRSVRMASGRRRHSYPSAPSISTPENYFTLYTTPSAAADIFDKTRDPSWAALENRLLMI